MREGREEKIKRIMKSTGKGRRISPKRALELARAGEEMRGYHPGKERPSEWRQRWRGGK